MTIASIATAIGAFTASVGLVATGASVALAIFARGAA
jgi:hypothetical protein